MNVGDGTFTLLFVSVLGVWVRNAECFISTQLNDWQSKLVRGMKRLFPCLTIRCTAILKSALMCLRGGQSHNLKTIDEFELVLHLAWAGLSKTKYIYSQLAMFPQVRPGPFTFIQGLVLLHPCIVSQLQCKKLRTVASFFYVLTILN